MAFNKKTENININIKTSKGFETLYNLYWGKVFAICYSNTNNVELSKEISQDIFKTIWERKDTLKIKKSFEHYLVRSAKLKVFEHFRTQSIRKKHLDSVRKDYCASANCTEDDVAYSLLVEELNLLVDKLPCRCRNVFKMSREQGMTNKKIATKLKISERAVEYHISKALGFLKNKLKSVNLT